jgi:hypothetical protein
MPSGLVEKIDMRLVRIGPRPERPGNLRTGQRAPLEHKARVMAPGLLQKSP